MNKAKKAIAERAKSVDMVIEMLDARMPASSENPLLAQLSKGKPKLKILNKQDLADPERTKIWLDTTTAAPTPVPSPLIPPKPAHMAKSLKPAAP